MNHQELLNRITFDPNVMCGKATIRGMRITAEQVLKFLAAGGATEDLFEDYPELEPADIRAVLLVCFLSCCRRPRLLAQGCMMKPKFLIDVGVGRAVEDTLRSHGYDMKAVRDIVCVYQDGRLRVRIP